MEQLPLYLQLDPKAMMLPILFLLSSVCVWSEGAFTFVLLLNEHSTSGNCDTFLNSDCETYFSLFCLRGSRADRSTDTNDCPLGASRQHFNRKSGRISISSTAEWEGQFQLFIQAFDEDIFSDDHLDDIFVEGSIRGDTLSSARRFTGRNNRVSVTVKYQRICDKNFYGLSCLNYCIPANSIARGHFTCNVNDGSKICLPGYSNPDNNCRENIDDCASGPCQNGGKCMDLVADFVCICLPGYTGKHCSVNINECKDAQCPGNSTCEDSVNSYTCVCNPGYSGDSCTEILDPCGSSSCGAGGSCIVLDSFNFTCMCPADYTGSQCEVNINEHLTSDCPPGTTQNSFQCLQKSKRFGSVPNGLLLGLVIPAVIILVIGMTVLCVVFMFIIKKKTRKNFEAEINEREGPISLKLDKIQADNSQMGLQSSTGSIHFLDNSFLYKLPEDIMLQGKNIGDKTEFGTAKEDLTATDELEVKYESVNERQYYNKPSQGSCYSYENIYQVVADQEADGTYVV